MDELLNCPFCGSDAHEVPYERSVECKKCTACTYNQDDVSGAIAQWNRRAPSAVERELRECLRDVMDVVMLWPEHPLRVRASALLAKKGSEE